MLSYYQSMLRQILRQQWAIFFPPLKQKLINSIFTSYFCLLYKIESGKVTSCYWHCFISFVKFFGCINNGLVVLCWPKWFNCWKVKHFKTHLLIYKFQYWNNSFRQRFNRALRSSYYKSGFRGMSIKLKSPVNVRKFFFFIHYQFKSIYYKYSVTRDKFIISFIYWNILFICTTVI